MDLGLAEVKSWLAIVLSAADVVRIRKDFLINGHINYCRIINFCSSLGIVLLLLITLTIQSAYAIQITGSVALNTMITKSNSMSDNESLRYYLAPATIHFSDHPEITYTITSPDQAWINIHADGAFSLFGQLKTQTENATGSITKLIDIYGSSKYDSINHNKLTGVTTYNNLSGSLSIDNWSWYGDD